MILSALINVNSLQGRLSTQGTMILSALITVNSLQGETEYPGNYDTIRLNYCKLFAGGD